MSILNPHLTKPQGDEAAAQQAASVPGMAHWAYTGPADTTCRQCSFWGGKKHRRIASYLGGGGELQPHRCIKYRRLMGGRGGPGIEHQQPSCKYFEASEKPPSIEPPPRKPREKKTKAELAPSLSPQARGAA